VKQQVEIQIASAAQDASISNKMRSRRAIAMIADGKKQK